LDLHFTTNVMHSLDYWQNLLDEGLAAVRYYWLSASIAGETPRLRQIRQARSQAISLLAQGKYEEAVPGIEQFSSLTKLPHLLDYIAYAKGKPRPQT
jgi:hypothetical protein